MDVYGLGLSTECIPNTPESIDNFSVSVYSVNEDTLVLVRGTNLFLKTIIFKCFI